MGLSIMPLIVHNDCECKYTIQIQRPVCSQDSFMRPLRFQTNKGIVSENYF